jgi:hypothetical protein
MNGLKLGWKNYEKMMSTLWNFEAKTGSKAKSAGVMGLKLLGCLFATVGLPLAYKWSVQRLKSSALSIRLLSKLNF